jgi:hypothetical protein
MTNTGCSQGSQRKYSMAEAAGRPGQGEREDRPWPQVPGPAAEDAEEEEHPEDVGRLVDQNARGKLAPAGLGDEARFAQEDGADDYPVNLDRPAQPARPKADRDRRPGAGDQAKAGRRRAS